jgi:hypothetical protein
VQSDDIFNCSSPSAEQTSGPLRLIPLPFCAYGAYVHVNCGSMATPQLPIRPVAIRLSTGNRNRLNYLRHLTGGKLKLPSRCLICLATFSLTTPIDLVLYIRPVTFDLTLWSSQITRKDQRSNFTYSADRCQVSQSLYRPQATIHRNQSTRCLVRLIAIISDWSSQWPSTGGPLRPRAATNESVEGSMMTPDLVTFSKRRIEE